MWHLIGVIVVLAIVVVAALFLKRFLPASPALPYVKRSPLLTPAEQTFHDALEEAVGGQYRIMCMVRLAEIITVRSGLDGNERQRATNRIIAKHIDFVLCNQSDFAVVCAIELDDASHQRRDRMDRDGFVDRAMQAAGIPLLHVRVRQSYSLDELRSSIEQCVAAEPGVSVTPTASLELAGAVPTCPNCNVEMVMRTSRSGDKFWGCRNYPKCRATHQV